jgi:hypothetical protein
MANVLQWIGLAFGTGVIALGIYGFFRGLSLPANAPEHRAHGRATIGGPDPSDTSGVDPRIS